jgi:predicted HD phosphohydrolase
MAQNAAFTRMDESNREEWMLIGRATLEAQSRVPLQMLSMLRSLAGFHAGFGVDQLHHSLHTASLAKRANAADEVVLGALCHDVGKVVSIPNHGPIAAEMLKPYVSRDVYHVLRTSTAARAGSRSRRSSPTSGTRSPSIRATRCCRWRSSSRW